MITSTDITQDKRRAAVRELSQTTAASYADLDIDNKINRWDDVARSYFDVQGVELDGTELYFQNLVTGANTLAAAAILVGIGTDKAVNQAREYRAMFKDLVKAQHGRAPEQHGYGFRKTSGNTDSIQGDFA